MRRIALLAITLASVVALGVPQIIEAAPQRARSRSASPAAKAPMRTGRPAQVRGPSRGISKRSPAAAPRSAPSGRQRQVGRAPSRGSGRAIQRGSGRTIQSERAAPSDRSQRGRVTTVRPSRPDSAVTTGQAGATRTTGQVRTRERTTGPSGAARTTGQVRARERTPRQDGAVTTVGQRPSRSRVVTVRQPDVSPAPAAQSSGRQTTRGRVIQRSNGGDRSTGRAAGVDRGGSRIQRRSPDGNIVGRAVPRQHAPLAASPQYGESRGRHQGIGSVRHGRDGSYASGYRSGYRYGFRSGHARPRDRHYGYSGGYGHRHYRHIHRPRFYYPAVYGSYFYFPGYSFSVGLGYGHHYGHGYSGYAYYPYVYDSYYGGSRYADAYTGFLRLKVKPRDAEVYVDGYYVGIVNSFDGIWQRLRLEEGTHHIELRHPAYYPLELEVLIVPGEKITYEGRLEPR